MKNFLLLACILLTGLCAPAQFLIFLDKGDVFKSPEVDMVVMDKYSFAKYHYISEKYDTLRRELGIYDSLLAARDVSEQQIRTEYDCIVQDKDRQITALTEGYNSMRSAMQASLDQQKKLEIDYLKLQNKNRRAMRWRNFFMGTTAIFGAVVYLVVR